MNYRTKLFLSYSRQDKSFARRLYDSLMHSNIDVWMDERNIRVGDDIRCKIEEGISSYDFFGIVLSNTSINSRWVQYELSAAFMREMEEKRVVILPIKIDHVKLPTLISSKRYADFSKDYNTGFEDLLSVLHEIVVRKIDLGSSHVVWNARKGDLNGDKRIKALNLLIESDKSIFTIFALIAGVGDRSSAIKASNVAANVLTMCITEPLKKIKKFVISSDIITGYFRIINESLLLEKSLDSSPEFLKSGVKMVFLVKSKETAYIYAAGDVCAIARWTKNDKRIYAHRKGKNIFGYSMDYAVATSAPLGFIYGLQDLKKHSRELKSLVNDIFNKEGIENKTDFRIYPEIVPFTGKDAFIALLSHGIPYDDAYLKGLFNDLGQFPTSEGISRFLCQKISINDHCMASVLCIEK